MNGTSAVSTLWEHWRRLSALGPPRRNGGQHAPGLNDTARRLVEFWLPTMTDREWPERLQLLEEIHRQLPPDQGIVSGLLTAHLIDAMGGGTITAAEQAFFYLNSLDLAHRDAATVWLVLHGLKADACEVDLAGALCLDRGHVPARLREVRSGFILIAAAAEISAAAVTLAVPFLDQICGEVCWTEGGWLAARTSARP